jgi:hypothetical protein
MEFLPENSTGLMQPLDVAVFKPVKTHWGKLLDTYRRQLRASNKSAAALPKIVSYRTKVPTGTGYRYRTGTVGTGRGIVGRYQNYGTHPVNNFDKSRKFPTFSKLFTCQFLLTNFTLE